MQVKDIIVEDIGHGIHPGVTVMGSNKAWWVWPTGSLTGEIPSTCRVTRAATLGEHHSFELTLALRYGNYETTFLTKETTFDMAVLRNVRAISTCCRVALQISKHNHSKLSQLKL